MKCQVIPKVHWPTEKSVVLHFVHLIEIILWPQHPSCILRESWASGWALLTNCSTSGLWMITPSDEWLEGKTDFFLVLYFQALVEVVPVVLHIMAFQPDRNKDCCPCFSLLTECEWRSCSGSGSCRCVCGLDSKLIFLSEWKLFWNNIKIIIWNSDSTTKTQTRDARFNGGGHLVDRSHGVVVSSKWSDCTETFFF